MKLKDFLFYDFNDLKPIIEKLQFLFECSKSRIFINSLFVCDNHSDCLFGEDEENCVIHFYEKFSCRTSNKLINIKHVCNHYKDCPDGSDEDFCSKSSYKYF